MNKYQVEKKIGKGSYGNVYICRSKSDSKRYVLKRIPLGDMSEKEKRSTMQEVALLRSLQHPNIVGYKDSFMTNNDKEMCIVMTFCEGGDLSSKIKEYQHKKIPEKVIMRWMVQILLAVDFLHSRKVLHRDLKSQNIFLTKDGTIKLGDFGIARVFDRTLDMAKTSIGTPLYMSPEVCNNRPYNYKSDIWSLGCILYELTAKKPPFDAHDLRGLFVKIIRGVYSPIPYTYSTKLRDLIRKMLYTNPHRRPSVAQILKSSYVTKYTKSFLTNYFNETNRENQNPNDLSHTIVMEKQEVSNLKIQVSDLGYNLDSILHPTSDVSSEDNSSVNSKKDAPHASKAPSSHPSKLHPSHKPDIVINKRKIPLSDVQKAVRKLQKMEEEQKRVKLAMDKLQEEKRARQNRLDARRQQRLNELSQKRRQQEDEILKNQRRKLQAAEERRKRIKAGLAAPSVKKVRRKSSPSQQSDNSSNSRAPSTSSDDSASDYKKRYEKINKGKAELQRFVEKRKQMQQQIQNIERELQSMEPNPKRGGAQPPSSQPSQDLEYKEHIKRLAQFDYVPPQNAVQKKVPSQPKSDLSGLSHRDRVLRMREMKRKAEEEKRQNALQQARQDYLDRRLKAKQMQYDQYHRSPHRPVAQPPSSHAPSSDLQSMLPESDRYQQNAQFIKQQQRRPSQQDAPPPPQIVQEHKNDDDDEESEADEELLQEMSKAYNTHRKQINELRKTITQAYGHSIDDLQRLIKEQGGADNTSDEEEADDLDTVENEDEESGDDEMAEHIEEQSKLGRLSDRISFLKNQCHKYFGESLFSRLYRVLKEGNISSDVDDRGRNKQLLQILGYQNRSLLSYCHLIDELIFCESTLLD